MKIPNELTSKLVLVVLALAVSSAVVGTAVAVPMVRSADIVNETILSEDIKNGEVKSQDLANGAVTADKIASGALELETHFVENSVIVEVGQARGVAVSCPSGEQVTGGGYHSDPDMSTYINSPTEGASGIAPGWQTAAQNNGSEDHQLLVFVMCAPAIP